LVFILPSLHSRAASFALPSSWQDRIRPMLTRSDPQMDTAQ
jgi:hypothetical protein